MKVWLTLYLLAQAADMASTAVKLHQGCREAIWPNAPVMYAGKASGIIVMFSIRDTHPTAAKIVSGIGIASGVYGTVHNLQQRCS